MLGEPLDGMKIEFKLEADHPSLLQTRQMPQLFYEEQAV
jgi:hypothetical protein